MFAEQVLSIAHALSIRESYFCFLFSGASLDYTGRYSIIAYDIVEFTDIPNSLDGGLWFGYIGYEFSNLTYECGSLLDMPKSYFMKFKKVVLCDHYTESINICDLPSCSASESAFKVLELDSNMTDNSYMEKVSYILDEIKAGNCYQVNLTRKYFGKMNLVDKFSLFRRLANISPAPYSSFIKMGNFCILSSSPEQFIRIDHNIATSRPIKGTVARDVNNAEKDLKAKEYLQNSIKDKSENLMITDLMRNDFTKGAVPGTVDVPDLFQITKYPFVYHLHSTVTAKSSIGYMDFMMNCFPPGSMTGAPKKSAINIAAKLENMNRGVYSGAIGWIDENSMELSVVIRTIVFKEDMFEFQVGGAIVNHSCPKDELYEIHAKARGICLAMGISLT